MIKMSQKSERRKMEMWNTHEYEFVPGTILDRKTGRRIFIKNILAVGAFALGMRLPIIERVSGAVAYWDTPPYTYYYSEKSSSGWAGANVSQDPETGKILMDCYANAWGSAYAMAYYDTNYAYPANKNDYVTFAGELKLDGYLTATGNAGSTLEIWVIGASSNPDIGVLFEEKDKSYSGPDTWNNSIVNVSYVYQVPATDYYWTQIKVVTDDWAYYIPNQSNYASTKFTGSNANNEGIWVNKIGVIV
ncbi:hypothetical protein [Ferroglobus placidus]|nr:hypothetical protein [Ferroglobus placidus]